MNRIELYHKTVDKLLDAYNSGELKHGDCSACAVGTICNGKQSWGYLFTTKQNGIQRLETAKGLIEEKISHKGIIENRTNARNVIRQSGYNRRELMSIEYAFENSIITDFRGYEFLERTKEGQFIGLTAVLKVLAKIHEIDKVEQDNNQTRLEEVYKNVSVLV